MRPFVKLLWSLSCNLRLSVCWIFQSLCVSCVDFSPAVFERGEFVNICCISSCRPIGHNVHLNKLSRHNWTTLYKMAQKWRKATELKCLHGGVATINASERAYFDNFIYDFPRSLLISLIGKQFWKSSGIIRNVRRILVRVVNTPLLPEAKKNWKFVYEMVHSEVYLDKYVVSIAPFSTPACPDCCQNIT